MQSWKLEELEDFILRHNLYVIKMDGCSVGVTDKNGVPIRKRWRIITNSAYLAATLAKLTCPGNHQHAACAGSETEKTGYYTAEMAHDVRCAVHHVPSLQCSTDASQSIAISSCFTCTMNIL